MAGNIGGAIYVWLSLGTTYGDPQLWWGPNDNFDLTRCGSRFGAADSNGDGKANLYCAYDYGSSSMVIFVWVSLGTTFSLPVASAPNGSFDLTRCGDRFGAANLDGDTAGKADLYCAYDYATGSGAPMVWLSSSTDTALASATAWWNVDYRLDLSYQYDPAGNVRVMADNANPAQTQTFGYDELDRLTSVGGAYGQTYAYAPTGNLTSATNVVYTYPASGQPHPHAVTSLTNGSSAQYTYDANGNMTQRVEGGVTYNQTFDVENRLMTVSTPSGTVQYIYDGAGQRVEKIENGQTTVYVGQLYEKNLSTSVATVYYYAGSRRVALRQIPPSGPSTLYYLVGDHLGSTSLTLKASTFGKALLADSLRYYPYGATRSGGSNTPTTFRFTGQRQDSYTELTLMGSRYYDPALARWIQPDSIVPDPNNPQTLNRYSYVNNRPLNQVDPTGHAPWPIDLIGGAVTQYVSDMTTPALALASYAATGNPVLETVVKIVSLSVKQDSPLFDESSDAYHTGQDIGRAASTVVATAQTVGGAGMALGSLAAMVPTAGGGGVCAIATGGTCALPAGVVLGAEGTLAAVGAGIAINGGTVLANNAENPITYMRGRGGETPWVLQTGGHTLDQSTRTALGLTKDQAKYAIETLKEEYGLANDWQGKIWSDGNITDMKGKSFGNLYDYLP